MSKQSNTVGKDTEQRVARWLRDEGGFPYAERTVRTGYRTAVRELVDAGDIDGTPHIVWQVKSLRPATRAETSVPGWMVETETQRGAAACDVGVLVVRRWGTTDVSRWWAFVSQQTMALLLDAPRLPYGQALALAPVRVEMAQLIPLLQAAGYGGVP